MENNEILISCLKELNIDINDQQLNELKIYYDLLIEWNSFMNLTAITQWDDVVIKHFVDSVSLIKAIPDIDNKAYSIVDIGTGAGFPGIPLKIVFPNLKITLIDSLNKRVKFLDEVITRLNLKDIDAKHGRAEDFGHNSSYRECFDICVSRAVANMTVLSEFCIPFVSVGGRFVSYKSEKLTDELCTASKAVSLLGGAVNKQIDFVLPHSDIYRNLLVIDKVDSTPKKYPRKAGTPAKEPLI